VTEALAASGAVALSTAPGLGPEEDGGWPGAGVEVAAGSFIGPCWLGMLDADD